MGTRADETTTSRGRMIEAGIIRARRLSEEGFVHGFSTREGGMSAPPFDSMNLARNVGDDPAAVEENHARFARVVGHDVSRLAEASQVHGVRCLDVDPFLEAGVLDRARVWAEQADALTTRVGSIVVGVRTADCVPVLVADSASGAVAAIHAGWRGAVDGVVARAIAALVSGGAHGEALVAAIGPHIRVASFEVGEEVAMAMNSAMPSAHADRAVALAGPLVDRSFGAKPHASLVTLVVAQLLEAGLGEASIEDVGGDTCAARERFHSHRRDGARSGRQLSVIVARSR
jgi:YfiH family protein